MKRLQHDVALLLETALGIHQREQFRGEHILVQEPLLTIMAHFHIILRMLIETVVRHLHHVIADDAARLLQGLTLLGFARCASCVPFFLIGLLSITGRLVALTHRQHDVVILFLSQRLARGGITLHQHQ